MGRRPDLMEPGDETLVEAALRLRFRTLDALDATEFDAVARQSFQIIRRDRHAAVRLAESFGLARRRA